MLEKPDIPDELIISRLQEEYDLRVTSLTFLPLGADMGTAVYRVVADDGTVYFLKLRKGFDEISVTVPLFLKSQGIKEIIAPFETKSNQGWADFGEYKLILYPFIEGENGFETELSDAHKRMFGAALKRVHAVQIPLELKKQIPQETYSPKFREQVKEFQRLVENERYQPRGEPRTPSFAASGGVLNPKENKTFNDLNAAKLAKFIKSNRNEIDRLIKRTEELASELQSQSHEYVLCHTDIHGGNILITNNDQFYIVDWDAPLLAPKERDLMFIGGGIDDIWKSERDESVFYEGYGKIDIDFTFMAYYRYERLIEDLAAYAEQLLLTNEGGADREEAYRRFTGNFEPGQTIEIADRTNKLLP